MNSNKPLAAFLQGKVGGKVGGTDVLRCQSSEIREMCRKLKKEGFNHLSFITAIDRGKNFELTYMLKQIGGEKLFLKTKVPREKPSLPSVTPVWNSANWHERETFDLFGIKFVGHPNLERILLHENWEGFPLRKDYDEEKEQETYLDTIDLAEEWEKETDFEVMHINVGPQHPATHGVGRVMATFDGELVEDVKLNVGFMHRGVEKLCEGFTFNQIIPYYDRMDWASPGMAEGAYVRAAEELLNIDPPPRSQYLRVIFSEIGRILGHLLMVASMAMDVCGVMGVTPMYCWREREKALDLLDELAGTRLTPHFLTIGGTNTDLSEGFERKCKKFIEDLREGIEDYHNLTTGNEVFRSRTIGTGVMSGEKMLDWGVTGPSLRASGVEYDVRKEDPYFLYDDFDFEMITYPEGDNFARFQVRMDEMGESCRIIEQALENLPSGKHKTEVPERISSKGEHYAAVENQKGEFGSYIVADGSNKPFRLKIRTPSFSNLACLDDLVEGEKIPDLIAGFASLDPVFGEVDR